MLKFQAVTQKNKEIIVNQGFPNISQVNYIILGPLIILVILGNIISLNSNRLYRLIAIVFTLAISFFFIIMNVLTFFQLEIDNSSTALQDLEKEITSSYDDLINQFQQAKNNSLNSNSDILSTASDLTNKINSLKSLRNIQKDTFQRNNVTYTQVNTTSNNIITTLTPYYTNCLSIGNLYNQKIQNINTIINRDNSMETSLSLSLNSIDTAVSAFSNDLNQLQIYQNNKTKILYLENLYKIYNENFYNSSFFQFNDNLGNIIKNNNNFTIISNNFGESIYLNQNTPEANFNLDFFIIQIINKNLLPSFAIPILLNYTTSTNISYIDDLIISHRIKNNSISTILNDFNIYGNSKEILIENFQDSNNFVQIYSNSDLNILIYLNKTSTALNLYCFKNNLVFYFSRQNGSSSSKVYKMNDFNNTQFSFSNTVNQSCSSIFDEYPNSINYLSFSSQNTTSPIFQDSGNLAKEFFYGNIYTSNSTLKFDIFLGGTSQVSNFPTIPMNNLNHMAILNLGVNSSKTEYILLITNENGVFCYRITKSGSLLDFSSIFS